jgi:uncharacterized protein
MIQKNALIVFVRNPVLGKVKTRIAKTLGDEAALRVYKKLLRHTHEVIKNVDCEKYIFYADDISMQDTWPNDIYKKEKQVEAGLGKKMEAAFKKVFTYGHEHVLIIGSDCYDLTAAVLTQAFTVLQSKDVVVGPAKDGGYYLLGQKKINPSLFSLEEWSTPHVLHQTITACERCRLSYEQLETLSDIDEADDIHFSYE